MRSKDFILSILLAATSTACVTVAAQAAEGTVIQPDSLTWAPAQGLPPGAEMAVLFGNPGKIGPFAVRFKFPAGYEIPTHSHPTDEVLTVLSGEGRMAFGQKVDAAHAKPLVAATFTTLPAGAWHHVWIDAETVIELHSSGLFGVVLAK